MLLRKKREEKKQKAAIDFGQVGQVRRDVFPKA